jgi:N-hydroxyarylamine O-acetyltransferase
MADPCIDLDVYFSRIGYSGPREPTLEVLRALHALHPAAIPFENLDPLMGRPPALALDALQAKLVTGGRGGYCYELNGLFKAALEALGFQVTGLAARVRWGVAEDAPLRPRTHMTLQVSLPEGLFLADVGFGGLVLTDPLRLDSHDAQATAHERFRLVPLEGGVLELQAELGQAWRALYRFDRTPYLAMDYEPLNWFSGSHPSSPFISNLMAARTSPQGRLTLADTRFTTRRPGQAPVERTLASMDELKSVLSEDFGLTLPDGIDQVSEGLGF